MAELCVYLSHKVNHIAAIYYSPAWFLVRLSGVKS